MKSSSSYILIPMQYLCVEINKSLQVCTHAPGEELTLSDASKSAGARYTKDQLKDEQKRINAYLESIGQSNYKIIINDTYQRQC